MDKRLLIAAFLEGFLLVAIELVYVQLLHPYYGDSYFAWLSMLAITMTASASGYFLGSFVCRQDEKVIRNAVIGALFVLSVFFATISLLSDRMFLAVADMDFLPSLFVHTTTLLFIPVTLITAFSPLIVKYHSLDEPNTGKAAGRVFFTSTLGGIIAVYGVAFALLPFVDLLKLLNTLAIGVLLINLFVLFSMKKLAIAGAEAVLLMIVLGASIRSQDPHERGPNTRVITREYGIMGEIEVREEYGRQRVISLNRTTQSAIEIASGRSAWSYPFRVSTYASLAPPGSDVLVAGLGGGVLVNQLVQLDLNVQCVEFDQRMVRLAKRHMNLNDDVQITIDDFRHHINATKRKYDLIILDLSKGETMPGNVYSVESFRRMRDLLKPDGFILLHYFSNVYGKGEFGLYSIMKTMKQANYEVGLVRKAEGDTSPEEIVLASDKPEIISNIRFRVPPELVQRYRFQVVDFLDTNVDYSKGLVLEDDKNTMEKVQLDIVSDIRQRLRENEHATFFSEEEKKAK